MFAVLASVLISALITIGLLLVTRQRLARQFEDVQRRLLQAERALVEIRVWRDGSTTNAQLARLHQGLVRTQESMAKRYGALLPLAEQWTRHPARTVTDFQAAALEQWTQALGGVMTSGKIRSWCAAIAAEEAAEPIPLSTVDLLALAIAADQASQSGRVDVAGDLGGSFCALLREALPANFSAENLVQLVEGVKPSSGLIVVGNPAENFSTWLAAVEPGGLVAFTAGEGSVPGLKILVSQWGVTAGRRLAESGAEATPATR